MILKITYTILLLITSAIILMPGYADETDKSAVSLFDEPLTVRFSLEVPIFLLCLKPDIGENESVRDEKIREDSHITYMPDMRVNGGLGLYYKGFGASYVSKIFNITAGRNKAVTNYTDIRLKNYYRKFGADLVYMDYKGFYLADNKSHGYSAEDPETKRSDIHLRTLSASAFYIFSDNFSFNAAFMQSERQNVWDWTLLGVFSAVHQSLSGEYSLIPGKNEPAFGNNSGINSGEFSGAAAGAGFGITVPYQNYLFTAVSYFGNGYMHRSYETFQGEKTVYDGFYRINAKASIGYTGNSYFFGMSFVFDSIANYSGIRILTNTYTTELYSGFRI